MRINGAPQEPRSPGRTGADRLLANPCGSSATQLFSKKITNKGMSVQFPRVVRIFPARSLAIFNRERSVRYSAGLNAVKDWVRPGMAMFSQHIRFLA
jgi:hypothetical protein